MRGGLPHRPLLDQGLDMYFHEYQEETRRTMAEPDAALTGNEGYVTGYALGLAGEAGEVVDLLKKHLFHSRPLDLDSLEKELGDVLWYLSAIATSYGLSLSDIAEKNVNKLRLRYPNGFTPEDSEARRDEAHV